MRAEPRWISIDESEEPCGSRWIKIFTWRANGDGINPFSNGLIEDCFIRTVGHLKSQMRSKITKLYKII